MSPVGRVLVVVAHPDDAEIGMAMRIAWHASRQAHVRVHCLSKGSASADLAHVRMAECLQAGKLLDVAEYTFSDVPDTRFIEHRGLINHELFTVIRETRPDVVYTHYPLDQHLDHVVTAEETTVVSLREAGALSYFRSPYSRHFEPNLFFLGSADLLERKVQALACFASQSQFDMRTFARMAESSHLQHIHHRVVERFRPQEVYSEVFRIERQIDFACGGIV